MLVLDVTLGVRVLKDVEEIAPLDAKDDVLNPMPRSALSFAFLASSHAKYFTDIRVARCVPTRHTLASAKLCPRMCPDGVRSRSFGTQRQLSLYAKTGQKSTISGLFSGSQWG